MLESFDPQIHELILDAQQSALIDLRPDRSYLSAAVLEALGSQLADHYVEGFPGRRFTRNHESADAVERLGNERLRSRIVTA